MSSLKPRSVKKRKMAIQPNTSTRFAGPLKLSKATLLIFALIFAGIGGYALWKSFAATTGIKGIGVMRLGNTYSTASGYDRYDLVVSGTQDAAKVGTLTGPSKKCVYMNAWSVSQTYLTGIPWAEANTNGWLLKDKSGNLLVNSGYTWNNILDVRNSAARVRYIESVSNFAAANKLNCIYIDDVLANIVGYGVSLGSILQPGYATYDEQEDAIVQFMAEVGPALKAKGLYVWANTGKFVAGDTRSNDGTLTKQFWLRIGPYMNGLLNEYWMQSVLNTAQRRNTGPEWYNSWNGWQGLVATAQSIGRDFYGVSLGPNTDIEMMRYGKASFMLDWNGLGGAFIWGFGSNNSGDPWNLEWTTDIGTPSAARYQVGVGYRRDYSGGTVLVNPSGSSSQTFSLGATYKKADGTLVNTVTLSPATGIILSSTTSTPPPPPSTPTVTLSASPTSIVYGDHTTLTWNSTNASSCAASGGWSGTKAVSGSEVFGPLVTSVATLTCTGAGGSATASVTVTVTSAPPPPAPVPTVSISANPSSISYNTGTTLTWSSTDSSSCAASGAWSGAKATNGSASTGPLTTTSTFGLACTGAGGTASSSTVVTVNSLPPSGDTSPPSAPSNFVVTSSSKRTVSLAWNASTDNVGVTDYVIYRNGSPLPATTSLFYNDSGLGAGSAYQYYVKARDAAGNVSTASQAICVSKYNFWNYITRHRNWSYC